MNAHFPIYTASTECQDCYKCIRECPVKAIKVAGGYASIVPDLCVSCGHCVEICPNGAKKVRDDRALIERLLRRGSRLVVSLAPSFASEFTGVSARQMVAALRRLGFHAVSETALGAQQVSAALAAMLREGPRVLVSSACPVVVEYVRKYRPDCVPYVAELLSPMLAHARMLRQHFGEETGVVFFGPCIAKKREVDAHAELIDAALTFEDLRAWFHEAGIAPQRMTPADDDVFLPETARDGALYPIEGGMLQGIRVPGATFMSFSGLPAVMNALDGLDQVHPAGPVLLELLACQGGCVNGPKTSRNGGGVARRYRVLEYADISSPEAVPALPIAQPYPADPVPCPEYTDGQIREVLRALGKHTSDDELNCGGCGYDSCRAFAAAYLAGRAERRMCVTHMRKLAEKKTHALMRKMPSAVVIVDESLRIIEYNPNFQRFFGAGRDDGALEGAPIDTVVPFYNLFQHVVETGEEILGRDIRFGGSVFHVTVFTIEKHALVGGIFRDVTEPSMQKEQIIERARQVIQKNLQTVQQIAYLMGENAAESEIALNSIVESFAPESVDEDAPQA